MRISGLDSLKYIRQIDRHRTIERLHAFPKELLAAEKSARKIRIPSAWKNTNTVVMAGMGGSGISGEIVRNLTAQKSSVPLIVVNGYELPAFVGKYTLVIATSFSGSTEETLSIAQHALHRQTRLFIICGARSPLDTFAQKHHIPHYTVTSPPPPRYALANLLVPALVVLEKIGIVRNTTDLIEGTVRTIEPLISDINEKVPTARNQAKQLAEKISGNTPIIIASQVSSSIAIRFEQQVNENAKQHAFHALVPEFSHNAVESLYAKSKFSYILIPTSHDAPRVQTSFRVIEKLLVKKDVPYHLIIPQGKNILAQLLFGIVLLDFVSYYLALLNKENPFDTPNIDSYKKFLKES